MQHSNRLIVIGASAGGLTALMRMVSQLSPQLPAPILVVLHIGKHRSQAAEILSANGPIPAETARTGVRPMAGHIYIAPSDHHLLLEEGVLRLFRGPKEHHARPAIDPLFRSAALEYGPGAIGVVLTGMLDDGSAGLRAIKACGGTAIVQDPQDAAHPSMPRAALANVEADHVAAIDAMADILNKVSQPLRGLQPVSPPEWLRIEHAVSLGRSDMRELASIGAPSRYSCPDCGGTLFEASQEKPLRFLCHTGHAYSLRSLATTHDEVADEAPLSALRALQEKSSLLHRLAQAKQAKTPGSEASVAAEALEVDQYIDRMRELVTDASSSSDVGDPVEAG